MKGSSSDLGSRGRKKRGYLKRLLARKVAFRPFDFGRDIDYAYVAYGLGLLKGLDPVFLEHRTPEEFGRLFTGKLQAHFEAHWSFFDEASEEPIGFALANVPPHSRRVVIMQEMIWYPWAKPRGVHASIANLMMTLHKRGAVVLDFAQKSDEAFFDSMQRNGVMRKVGGVRDLYPDGAALLYQSWLPTARRS